MGEFQNLNRMRRRTAALSDELLEIARKADGIVGTTRESPREKLERDAGSMTVRCSYCLALLRKFVDDSEKTRASLEREVELHGDDPSFPSESARTSILQCSHMLAEAETFLATIRSLKDGFEALEAAERQGSTVETTAGLLEFARALRGGERN